MLCGPGWRPVADAHVKYEGNREPLLPGCPAPGAGRPSLAHPRGGIKVAGWKSSQASPLVQSGLAFAHPPPLPSQPPIYLASRGVDCLLRSVSPHDRQRVAAAPPPTMPASQPHTGDWQRDLGMAAVKAKEKGAQNWLLLASAWLCFLAPPPNFPPLRRKSPFLRAFGWHQLSGQT